MGEALQRAPAATPVHYEPRRPEETTLYRLVQEKLETFLAQVETESGSGLPKFVKDEFDGFHRAPPTTTAPKPAEATLGFSSTRKTIDKSPGCRYSSDQKKRLFKFPIRRANVRVIRDLVHFL